MAKKSKPLNMADTIDYLKGNVDKGIPALTAQSYAMVKSLKKANHRLADYLARMMAGESCETTGNAPPRSIANAIGQGHALAASINKLLDGLEHQI